MYKIIELSLLTSKNIKGLDYKENYINYYVGNDAVLVSIYNDINDKIAMYIIGK
ncbi:agmatine deiminase family protein [Brachyspira sp.]|uniref:agmatine deiminase family protein n=1 Tax=Brachyspira sp. TaxID=1977261 RepID=UPI00262417D6|nr:agmatine deiminase family protein [Brachyspira sp.]